MSIPKNCSECRHEKPFPVKQNIHYKTHCGLLQVQKNDGFMYCIKKELRIIQRREDCPLEKAGD